MYLVYITPATKPTRSFEVYPEQLDKVCHHSGLLVIWLWWIQILRREQKDCLMWGQIYLALCQSNSRNSSESLRAFIASFTLSHIFFLLSSNFRIPKNVMEKLAIGGGPQRETSTFLPKALEIYWQNMMFKLNKLTPSSTADCWWISIQHSTIWSNCECSRVM